MALIQTENWSEFPDLASVAFKGLSPLGRPPISGGGSGGSWPQQSAYNSLTAANAGKTGNSPALSVPLVIEQARYTDDDGTDTWWTQHNGGLFMPVSHAYNETQIYSMWFKISHLAAPLMVFSIQSTPNVNTRLGLVLIVQADGNIDCRATTSPYTSSIYRSAFNNSDLSSFFNTQFQGTSYGDSSEAVTPPISEDTWHFIEVKYQPHTLTGKVVVRIDNQEYVNFTGTTCRAVHDFDSIHFSSYKCRFGTSSLSVEPYVLGSLPNATTAGVAVDVLFDGIFVTDDTGTTANDFLGPSTLYSLKPNSVADNGEGGQSQFTTVGAASQNAAVATVDGDTSYIQAVAPGNITFNYGDLPAVGSIIGMELNSFARRTGNDAKNLQYKLGAGETSAGSAQAIQSTYSPIRQILAVNPATGNPWTKAEVDALQVKIETTNG